MISGYNFNHLKKILKSYLPNFNYFKKLKIIITNNNFCDLNSYDDKNTLVSTLLLLF